MGGGGGEGGRGIVCGLRTLIAGCGALLAG